MHRNNSQKINKYNVKHMKRYSSSLIKKIKTVVILRYHFSPTSLAKIPKSDNTLCGKALFYIASESREEYSLYGDEYGNILYN